MLTTLLLIQEKVNVEAKLLEAPDSSYQLGVLIGSFLPVVLLVGIAYWMYNSAKKADKERENH